jgi:hypothetical protein
MAAYSTPPQPFDAARAALSKAEIARGVPTIEGDPAFLYVAGRGIPAATVLGCSNVQLLPAPIPGRPKTDFACVSLLRPAPDAEVTGAELTFIDILGHPTPTEPRRIQWAFEEHGCRNSWFWAGGSGDTLYCAEGFLVKPLAILSLGLPGMVAGWGARSWLQFKELAGVPKRVVICPDRRPA